ncbi:MAG: permease [Candidatus Omnitrophota bacterium]
MLLNLADWFVYDLLRLPAESRLSAVLHYFLYDSVKILLMLFILIFLIGVARTYLPREKIRAWMGRRGIAGNIFASLFGAITPFCSCSSIPLFLGFLEAGIPLGATFSFLVTSPLINEYLVVLMLSYFGWKITVLYILTGLLMGIVAGVVIGRMKVGPLLVNDIAGRQEEPLKEEHYAQWTGRLKFGWDESVTITRKIWIWVLAGVGVGALIHNYIPQELIQGIIGRTGIFSVPIAALIGVPLYGSCAAIVPVAVVLFQKGIPLGTALTFMMAMSALSLPEAVMLRRAMRLKLILIFFGITTAGIIITGYLFNLLQTILI